MSMIPGQLHRKIATNSPHSELCALWPISGAAGRKCPPPSTFWGLWVPAKLPQDRRQVKALSTSKKQQCSHAARGSAAGQEVLGRLLFHQSPDCLGERPYEPPATTQDPFSPHPASNRTEKPLPHTPKSGPAPEAGGLTRTVTTFRVSPCRRLPVGLSCRLPFRPFSESQVASCEGEGSVRADRAPAQPPRRRETRCLTGTPSQAGGLHGGASPRPRAT